MCDNLSTVFVSVVVPCRNEESHLGRFLANVCAQRPVGSGLEVLVAEGGSSDKTRSILQDWASRDSRLRVIDNPEGTVSCGLNRAINQARGDVVVRMDVHTIYAADYIYQAVKTLIETGADNVGGPVLALGTTIIGKANALAYHFPLAFGGSSFHNPKLEGYVESVPYGCWRRSLFHEIGLFDESLVRNQDDELNFRIRLAGGRVWQSPNIRLWYLPRSSLRKLWRQYFEYGYWKPRIVRKHRRLVSVRHVVPATFVVINVVLLMLALCGSGLALGAWGLLLGTYVAGLLVGAVMCCVPQRAIAYFGPVALVIATYHVAYGVGSIAGLWRWWLEPVLRGVAGESREDVKVKAQPAQKNDL